MHKRKRLFESPATSMRRAINLTEAGLIPNKNMMIRIDPNVYKLMKSLLFIVNPDSYVDNNPHGDKAMMVFTDKMSFENTTKKLKQFGIPFEMESKSDFVTDDGELMPQDDINISPYPGNKGKPRPKRKVAKNPYRA